MRRSEIQLLEKWVWPQCSALVTHLWGKGLVEAHPVMVVFDPVVRRRRTRGQSWDHTQSLQARLRRPGQMHRAAGGAPGCLCGLQLQLQEGAEREQGSSQGSPNSVIALINCLLSVKLSQ